MAQASSGDLRTLANGLFPTGGDVASLPQEGKDEVIAAIDVILKLNDYRNTKLAMALRELDRAAAEIDRLNQRIRELEAGR